MVPDPYVTVAAHWASDAEPVSGSTIVQVPQATPEFAASVTSSPSLAACSAFRLSVSLVCDVWVAVLQTSAVV